MGEKRTYCAVDRITGSVVLAGYLAVDEDDAWRQMREDVGGEPPETAREAGLDVREQRAGDVSD